jgi:hypothetical protein
MRLLVIIAMLVLVTACLPLTDKDGNVVTLRKTQSFGLVMERNIISGGGQQVLKAQVKGSIYETGEMMSVFGTCLNASDQAVLDGTYAMFNAWYPNGTLFIDNTSMSEVQSGYFLYQGAMQAVQGTYLTEMICHINTSSEVAKAWGEWQNPYWVRRLALLNDSLVSVNNTILGVNQSIMTALNNITVHVNIFNVTTYYPVNVTTICGTDTSGNNVGNLSYADGQTYNVSESVGACAFEVRVNFTNVSQFNHIQLYEEYLGSGATHTVVLEMWDYNSSSWEQYLSYQQAPSYIYYNVPVVDGSAHNQSGIVQVRLRHTDNGNAAHRHSIDLLVLTQDTGVNIYVDNGPVLTAIAQLNSNISDMIINSTGNITIYMGNLCGNMTSLIMNQSGNMTILLGDIYVNLSEQIANLSWNISNWISNSTGNLSNLIMNASGNITVTIGNLSYNISNSFNITWQNQNYTNALINNSLTNITNQLIYVANVANSSVDRNDSYVVYLLNLLINGTGTPVTHVLTINETSDPVIYMKNWNIWVDVKNEYNVSVGWPVVSCFINTTNRIPTVNQLMTPVTENGNPHIPNMNPSFTWQERVSTLGDFSWVVWCVYN